MNSIQIQKEREEKASIKQKIKELNISFQLLNFNELPDLSCDLSNISIQKTLKIFFNLLEDRQKQIDQKSEIQKRVLKQEAEQEANLNKVEGLNLKIKDLTLKIDFFKNKISLLEKSHSKEIERLTKEKDESLKTVQKISLKESQYKHEIKRLDSQIEDLKSKLKKYMNDNKEIRIVDNKNEKIIVNDGGNTIIFDNFLKNSTSTIQNQINSSRDFYSLIFKSYNDKVKILAIENNDLRECIKNIRKEINQYIDFKKEILFRFCRDSIEKENILTKSCSEIINPDIFNLDYKNSKININNHFNEIIDNFRFLLIYDFYKIDPDKEFYFDEIKRTFKNNKFSLENIPYYANISSIMNQLKIDKIIELKNKVQKIINFDEKYKENDEEYVIKNNENIKKADNSLQERIEKIEENVENDIEDVNNAFQEVEYDVINLINELNSKSIHIDSKSEKTINKSRSEMEKLILNT